MKAATLKELKEELANYSQKELVEMILSLAKFKKENKELLSYIIYESVDEDVFIDNVKEEIERMFQEINNKNFYFIKKSVRKILRTTKKYIRYSKKKETDVALRIYYCNQLKKIKPSIFSSTSLKKLYNREMDSILTVINSLHEDLQFDYLHELEELNAKGKS